MCDVAFLLLSFFILTTKFKPSEALSVTTPSSVSSKVAPEKDVVLITQDKDMIDALNTSKNLGLSDAEKAAFVKKPDSYIGVPFSQMKSYLDKTPEELKTIVLAGIPVKDSTDNELKDWIAAAVNAFQGTKMNLLVKGDDAAKYPAFQGVIYAFKKNDQLKFQLVTTPVAAPAGSELWKVQQASGSKAIE
jgi:biopolymer transport protein ExbD